ncbi:hypothetical protein Acr_00g0103950 [Actinidia rufa]|uniref:Uncharacterized protein n=1 Tax=Actinidia rufa TaxID=165716 RepID=A0A7J0E135_9ERIC|nr:hypothetical protein Acr_00g0103950 [Actinidia rufa]
MYNSSESTLSPSSGLSSGHPAFVAPVFSDQTSTRVSKHLLALLYHSGSFRCPCACFACLCAPVASLVHSFVLYHWTHVGQHLALPESNIQSGFSSADDTRNASLSESIITDADADAVSEDCISGQRSTFDRVNGWSKSRIGSDRARRACGARAAWQSAHARISWAREAGSGWARGVRGSDAPNFRRRVRARSASDFDAVWCWSFVSTRRIWWYAQTPFLSTLNLVRIRNRLPFAAEIAPVTLR